MPETRPDFDQIARQIAIDDFAECSDGLDELTRAVERAQGLRDAIAEQLRLIWNARGAADLAILNDESLDTADVHHQMHALDR